MELSFMVKALGRFWWVGSLCAALVFVPVYALKGGSTSAYESDAVLLVSPPGVSPLPNINTSDRYIAGQVSILQSTTVVNAAAQKVGVADNPVVIRRAVQVIQTPATDVVTITATAPTPERAQEIAAAYVDGYLDLLQAQLDAVQSDELALLDANLADLGAELAEVDAEIAAVLAPYLPTGPIDLGQSYPPVPAVEQVAPHLVSEKQNLLTEIEQILGSRSQLESTSKLRVTTRVLQPASLPTVAVVSTNRVVLTAALVGAIGLGVIAAVVAARLSPRVLDNAEYEEILGAEPVGVFPTVRAFKKDRRAAFESLPAGSRSFVEMVCVRAETLAPPGGAITVAVVGSQRSAGCTTLAATMANVLGSGGVDVLLIDADTRAPELSTLFKSQMIGIDEMILMKANGDDLPELARPSSDSLPSIGARGVHVVGMDGPADVDSLIHGGVRDTIAAATSLARIVVVDGGPMLDTVTAIHLVKAADVVVLAMPWQRQRRKVLRQVVSQFDEIKARRLSVLMPSNGA